MATLLDLANSIENKYSAKVNKAVKVCRAEMKEPLSESNLPFLVNVDTDKNAATLGIQRQQIKVKAKTSADGDFTILIVEIVHDMSKSDSYALTEIGRATLHNYMRTYRPFPAEDNNLWEALENHFTQKRGLTFVEKTNYEEGTPVTGKIKGIRLLGDGLNETAATQETWVFQAYYQISNDTAGWGRPGHIKSWRI